MRLFQTHVVTSSLRSISRYHSQEKQLPRPRHQPAGGRWLLKTGYSRDWAASYSKQSNSSGFVCRRDLFPPCWLPWLQSLGMSLALCAVAWSRALQSRWGLLLLPAWGTFLHPRAGVCIARGRQFSFVKSLKVLNFFFLNKNAWSRISIKQQNKTKKPQYACEAYLCQNICFELYALIQMFPPLLSEVTSRSQRSEIWPEKNLAWNCSVFPAKMPQALKEWHFSAKVNLVKNLWPPSVYS